MRIIVTVSYALTLLAFSFIDVSYSTNKTEEVKETASTQRQVAQRSNKGKYESFPVIKASALLPPDLLKGKNHQVLEEVTSDCLFNSYKIKTPYGEFDAYSTFSLRVRVKEIEAIAKLKKTSGAEAAVGGVAEGVMSSYRAAINVAEKPVKTVKGVPGGVASFFKQIGYAGKDAVAVAGEVIAPKSKKGKRKGDRQGKDRESVNANYLVDWYFGISGSERKLARRLGVDPYTSNPVLAAELKRVGKYERYGRIGTRLLPLQGIAALGLLRDVNRYVWDKDPKELKEFNEKNLREMKVNEKLIQKFFESPYYSPTFQTTIVFGLKELDGVTNREEVIKQSLAAAAIPEARFFTETVVLLVWFHKTRSPFKSLLPNRVLPVGMTEGNRVVSIFPADYLCWSKEIAEAANAVSSELREIGINEREFLIVGIASDRAKEEFRKLGWSVQDNISAEMVDVKQQKAAQQINTGVYKAIQKKKTTK